MLKNVERVKKVFIGQVPDQVPKGELLIDEGFIREFLKIQPQEELSLRDEVKFLKDLDIDLISLQPQPILKNNKDPWGRGKDLGTGLWDPVFNDVAEIENYQTPSTTDFDFSIIKKWSETTDFFVFAVVSGGFDVTASLLGFMEFLKSCKQNQDTVKVLMDKITLFNASLAKAAVNAGAHGIIIGDDIAYNQGTFLSPKMLRQLLFPALKKQVEIIKELKVPVVFHADGNISQVLDDIVEMGFDGVHSLQPSAGMDIKAVKEKYGDKLVLMGNMDLDYLVPLGSKNEIEQAVQETITIAKAKGKFIFGTCGALSEGLPIDNVKHLYFAAKKYGRY